MGVHRFFGYLIAMAIVASGGWAYPTLTGPTGLAVIPTAEIAVPGLTLAGDYHRLDVDTTGATSVGPIRALFALGNSGEVGATYETYDTDAPIQDALGANGKMNIGSCFGGKTVLGVLGRRETRRDGAHTDAVQGYVAWTTDFEAAKIDTSNIAVTWGVNWTRLEPSDAPSVDAFRGFAGVKLLLTRQIHLLAEYQSQNTLLGDEAQTTALTARFLLMPSMAAEIGFTNAVGLRATTEQTVFGGVNMNFIFDTGNNRPEE